MDYYIHNVPGRLRVRIPAIRGNAARCAEVEEFFDVLGVDRVIANPVTGSLVIHYDCQWTTPEILLAILNESNYYDKTRAIGFENQIQRASNKAARHAGRAAFSWVVGKTLEANGLGLLAALI